MCNQQKTAIAHKAQLATGRFASAEDVINEAFNLLQERERRIGELRQKIAVGLVQIERGEVLDGEVVMARLEEKIQTARESQM
ncbi:type II toxin-antitoxin system ParD family antitoxin [Tolypothrix sp. PCC 7910]|uniref:ribbon-helix-helix domain-containing protein n=1 Tax=Tolypothrix sp. PCC 7910 TaxID=2099387 RepID=UPI001427888E|nr:type II toxin-antitoxin system ParD family antitoxin [Tolypothrix sp. PCC 7910]QIR41305.1 type II toxin-antitoxin system ParD family antitoxin [Tolypothrix sp. PCC 7910]